MSKITPESLHYYHHRLGEIIDRFSWVEAGLQTVLRTEARVSDAVGKAIFSGVRIDQAMSFCRRIWDAEGREHPPGLERAFAQLGLLNSVRNDIVHFGAAFSDTEDGLFASNERNAHTALAVRRHQIDSETLHSIFNDLTAIICSLELHYLKRGGGQFGLSPEGMAAIASQPWQYRSQPQAPRGRKSPSKLPSPPRPPKSSRV